MGQTPLSNGSLVLEGGRADTGRYQCRATLPSIGTILSRVARVSFQGRKGGKGDSGHYQCRASLPSIGTILSRVARVSFQGRKGGK